MLFILFNDTTNNTVVLLVHCTYFSLYVISSWLDYLMWDQSRQTGTYKLDFIYHLNKDVSI
jgi:hypothetical protein